jgi:hypothetical protein
LRGPKAAAQESQTGFLETTPTRSPNSRATAIGEAELLLKLHGTVIVPGAVWAELQAETTPPIVKTWLGSPPDWLEVRFSHGVVSNEPALDALFPTGLAKPAGAMQAGEVCPNCRTSRLTLQRWNRA